MPQVVHPEQSPLLLCDTCPRSFHQACLGLDSSTLPSGDWCCPKCVDSSQAALRRVMDQQRRRSEATERAAMREKVGRAGQAGAQRACVYCQQEPQLCWRSTAAQLSRLAAAAGSLL